MLFTVALTICIELYFHGFTLPTPVWIELIHAIVLFIISLIGINTVYKSAKIRFEN